MRFPEGESKENFSKRSLEGFERALGMCRCDKLPESGCTPAYGKAILEISSAVFVVHGGTIMSIMEKYAVPKRNYYDFQIGNGEGYELVLEDDAAAFSGLYSGSDTGRPDMALSSGADDRSIDCTCRKNYKRLSA